MRVATRVATLVEITHNSIMPITFAAHPIDGDKMQEFNKQKIFWHSRRGMLELDLLLVPFATDVFESLSRQDQLLYIDFLKEEDQDLFAWLMQRAAPSEQRFESIIQQILAHNSDSA